MKRLLPWTPPVLVLLAISVVGAATAPSAPLLPPEQAKLAQGREAFGADRYREAIRLAREVLASATDPEVRVEAEDMLTQALRWQSRYQAAIAEAEKLKTVGAAPGGDQQKARELAALEEMIGELKEAQAAYQKALAE